VARGASTSQPAFDHVQIAVSDLDDAAARFHADHGLRSLAGGHHPGRGTANRIIPLGDSYLELITITDVAEAANQPTSLRVARALAERAFMPVWIVRTDDLGRERERLLRLGLALPPLAAGSRQKPDGTWLEWRMQELVAEAIPSPLPFLIEWLAPPENHPGWLPEADPQRNVRFQSLVLSHPYPAPARRLLSTVLRGHACWRVVEGEPGVRELVMAAPGRVIRLG